MTFDTMFLLEEFRAMQPELFDENGKAYPMTDAHAMSEMMLKVINALEQEVIRLDIKLNETYI